MTPVAEAIPKPPTAAPTPTISAPISAPAASPKPAAVAPAVSVPSVPVRRPTVDPKRALGLPESPHKSVEALVAASRAKNGLDKPIPGVPSATAPKPMKITKPAPVTNPAAQPPVPVLEAPEAAPAVETPAQAPVAQPAPQAVDPKDALIAKLQRDLDAVKNPAPAAAPTPEPAPEVPETPEQRAARAASWVDTFAQSVPADMTEAEMDTILGGGEEAVKALTGIRKKDIARGVLEARTSIYREIQPVVDEMRQALGVLLKQHIDVQRFSIESQFFTKYPDMVPQTDYTRQVADYLLQTFPQECAKLTPEAFIDYLHGETVKLLDTQAKRLGLPTWKPAAQAAPAPQAAPAAPVPGIPTHLSAPGPTGPTSIPRPTMPTNPPSSMAPGAAPVGVAQRSWGASVAADLRN